MKDAMEKMSAGTTIADAYGSLIRRFFSVLGLIWLPVAIYAAGAIALAPTFFAHAARIAETGLSPTLWRDGLELAAMFVAALALLALPAVSLSRLTLGLEKDRYAAHLTFGVREARLFLASLRLLLVFAAIAIAVGIAAYLFTWALASFDILPIPLAANGLPSLTAIRESPTLGMGVFGAELIAAAAVLYAGVRFGFFLAPQAAAEDSVSLRRAWALSEGKFWPMLAVALAVVIPVWLVALAGTYFALAADFGRFYGFAVESDQPVQHLAEMAGIVAAHAAPLMAVKAAGLFLFSSLFFAAFASAYPRPSQPETRISETVQELPPIVAPVAVAAAPAATEPSIERSLLEQFGANVHDMRHAPDPLPEDISAPETHAAGNGHAPPLAHAEPEPAAQAEPDDILELETIHEIHEAAGASGPSAPLPAGNKNGDHTLAAYGPRS